MVGLFGKFRGFYLLEKVRDFFKGEKGQTMVEYSVILVLISVTVLIMVGGIGKSLNNSYSSVNSIIQH